MSRHYCCPGGLPVSVVTQADETLASQELGIKCQRPDITPGPLFEKVGIENNHLLSKGNKNISGLWIRGKNVPIE